MITEEQVLKALSYVEDPDFKKDLVTLNMIKDIEITPDVLSFTVVLTTPACPMKEHLENACRNAIAHFVSKDITVNIHMSSRVIAPKNVQLPKIKHIVLVSSGKGGVGKSTVAANLALSLSMQGAKTGLLDADIYGPSVPIMFGVEGARPKSIATPDGKSKIEPIEKWGLKLISMGFFTDPNQPVPWRGPMASTAVKQLFNDVEWGELDYLIVDLPPGTGDIHITIAQGYSISGAVIVTTPQNVATADASKGLSMFLMESINIPILGVIENMAYFTPAELPDKKYYIFGKGGGKELSERFEIPFLGEIPLVKSISDAGDSGIPTVLDEEVATQKSFMDIASRIAQQLSIINEEAINEGISH